MTGWSILDDELSRWADAGRVATMWWRDDDAVAATPALERLLAMRRDHGIGLALAVVPAAMEVGLTARLRDEPAALAVLQHGYAHINHAGAGEKTAELGAHRPVEVVAAELRDGARTLAGAFGARFLRVVAPPWNRIAPTLLPALRPIGFLGLTTYGARTGVEAAPGVPQVNCHMGPVEWRDRPRFIGEIGVLATLAGALAARRAAAPSSPVATEPTGVLTHHLVHDSETWIFLDRLWARLRANPAVRIEPPAAVFEPPRL